MVGPGVFELDAQGLEGLEHVFDVFGLQKVVDDGGAFGEGGKEEDAVADGFAPREFDGAIKFVDGLDGQLLHFFLGGASGSKGCGG